MIKGFQGTSLLDFPGRLASLLFWGGCNLTCPFCHNPGLVLDPAAFPDLDRDELLEELAGRAPFIDGVVISGGEPTLDPALPEFLAAIKRRGLAVKLDTNGLCPDALAVLLDRRLVDYLAIDLKTLPSRYPELHPGPVDPAALLATVRLVMASSVPAEFRTTCIPGLVDAEVVAELGQLIDGAPLWALQQYHPSAALDPAWQDVSPYSAADMQQLAAVARRYAGEVVLRGL